VVHDFTGSIHPSRFYLLAVDMGYIHQLFQMEYDPAYAICGVGKL